MLGDMKAQTKPELTRDSKKTRRKNSFQAEAKLLDRLECSAAKRARLAQRRLSSDNQVKTQPLPTTMSMSKDNANLLDVQYMTLAMKCLSSVHEWNFNVFTLDLLTDGRSLFHMSLQLFFNCGFIEVFQLDVIRLMRCLALIESGYYISNPYHNSVHAADVVQAMYCNLQELQMSRHLKPLEKMSAIIAAASHDLDHPGVNQAFLIATSNPLASLYHNTSVLENHHWHSMVGILHESRVFEHFDKDSWKEVMSLTQAMILATDITRQQEILCLFRDRLDNGNLDLQSNDLDRSFVLQIMLKCADICNPCRSWSLSRRWSEMICEEFFRQGDCERKLGLPVVPLYDRLKSSVAMIQTGFMVHVVEPLFIEWNRFLDSSLTKLQLDNLRLNRSKWDEILVLDKLKAQTVTVVACTENVITSEISCPNADYDDKENDNPVLSDTNLINYLSQQLGKNGHRRHSLPTDRISESVSTCSMFTKGQSRRHSLPNFEKVIGNGSSVLATRRLSSLNECSPIGEDQFDFDKNSNIRHVHGDEITNSELVETDLDLREIHRRCSEVVQTSCLQVEENLTNRRASFPLNVANHVGKVSVCENNGQGIESGCMLRQLSSVITPVTIFVPLHNKNSSDHCTSRKFSLTSPEESNRSTNAERKRSCSLATSTLLYPVNENMSRLKLDLISNVTLDSCCWQQQPTKSDGLLNTSYLEKCNIDDQINHLVTSKNLPKPVLSVMKNTQVPTGNISGNEMHFADRAAPSPAKVNQVQTVQVLSSRPVITRTVDIHSRAPKGVTRKATSVFTSVADGEVVPLLPKRADLHVCDDDV